MGSMGLAVAAMALASVAPVVVVRDEERDPKLPSPEEEARAREAAKRAYLHEDPISAAPRRERTFTEADNTRLREAAERRFRKAQRQAKGFAR